MKLDSCRSCNARIVWVRMPSGKMNPLDSQPSPNGNVRVNTDTATGTVVPKEERIDNEPLYLSHFATCANAKNWRKK